MNEPDLTLLATLILSHRPKDASPAEGTIIHQTLT